MSTIQPSQSDRERSCNWLLSHDRIAASVSLVFTLVILQRLLQVARIVVFARLLGPEQYGIYTLGMFLVPLLATIGSLGVQAGFVRYVARYKMQGTLRWFVKRTYYLTLAISVLLGAGMLVRPSLFSRLLYGDPSQTLAILVVAASIPGYLLIRNLATTFMGLKLFRAGSFPEFVQAIVYAAVGIPLALVLRTALAGLLGFTLATYVSVGLFLFLLIRYLRNLEPTYRVAAEPGFHRHLLSFSLWFVVTPVLGQFFHYVDRLSLQHLRGAFDQGVYSAVVNIAETISAFGLAISSVVYPHISAIWESGDRERALVNLDLAFRVTGVLMLVLGLLLVLFGRLFILLLLGDKYLPGAQALPFLVVYYLFTVFVWLLGVYPTLIERTYVGAIALVIALPTSILLNRVLIPHLGMVGAALATMLSYLLMWMIVVILCRRFGMKTGRRTLSVCLLAFLLLLPSLLGSLVARVPCGPSAARLLAVVPDLVGVTAIGLVVYACIRRTWILSAAEREIAFTEVRRTVARFWGAVSRRR